MAITQVISSPVSLPTPPNPATDEEQEFDDKAYPYTVAQNEFGLDMQQISTELNTFAIQANALGLEVSNNATNAANQVVLAAAQVALASDQVALAAAQVDLASDQVALAQTAATIATNAAAAAEISKIDAQDIVDSISTVLPPGTLVDGLISNTTTWSSEKISAELGALQLIKQIQFGGL